MMATAIIGVKFGGWGISLEKIINNININGNKSFLAKLMIDDNFIFILELNQIDGIELELEID